MLMPGCLGNESWTTESRTSTRETLQKKKEDSLRPSWCKVCTKGVREKI